MKKRKKQILNIVGEIIIAVMFIILSIPLWISFQSKSYGQIAASYNDIGLNLEIYKPLTDIYLLNGNSNESEYVVKNYSAKKQKYELIILVDNETKIDLKSLYISINGEIYKLDELETYNLSSNNVFILDNNIANKYEMKTYDLRLLIDDYNVGNLDYEIKINKG